jgi:hypothetical protein
VLRISGNVHFDNRALPNLHGIKRFEDAVFIFRGDYHGARLSVQQSRTSFLSIVLLDLADMLLSEAQVLSRSMNIRKVVELLS